MTSITLTIARASVTADIRVKSHAEVATITDETERYLVEAGTEKIEEINQCITDAFQEAISMMRPFLTGEITATANDAYATGDLTLALSVTARKAAGLSKPLADAVHKYVVNSAMAKFYRSVSRPNLVEAHERSLTADIATIEGLIYRRSKPTYTRPQPQTTEVTQNEDENNNNS